MKKLIVLAVILSLTMLSATFAQDHSVYFEYKIPTFKYNYLRVEGNDLLNWYNHGDANKHTNMNLSGDYTIKFQSPEFSWYASEMPSFTYSKVNDLDAVSIFNNHLMGGVEKYFGAYAGPHAFGELHSYFNGITDAADDQYVQLYIGGGYGRVTDAYPVARAIAVASELGGGLGNGDVLKLADIIARAGEYYPMFKDDELVKYYEDLGNAVGKPNQQFKIHQVLSSPIYPISPRYVGWFVRGYYTNKYFIRPELAESPKGNIGVRGEWAKPLDLQKQVRAWVDFQKPLDDDAAGDAATADMEFGGRFTMDHTYNWASFAYLTYHSYGTGLLNMAPYYDDSMIALGFGTTKAIINKLYGTASFDYSKLGEEDDAAMGFKITFGYWVF